MKLSYVAFIEFEKKQVNSIRIPDLKISLERSELRGLVPLAIKEYLDKLVKDRLEELQAMRAAIPEPKEHSAEPNEIELRVNTEVIIKKRFFAKFLPLFGKLSNVVSVTANTVISAVALRLVTDSMNDKNLAWTVSITNAVTANGLAAIAYSYSEATAQLEKLGHRCDAILHCDPVSPLEEQKKLSCKKNSSLVIMEGLKITVLAVNTIGLAATAWVQLSGLGDAVEEKGIMSHEVYDPIKAIGILAGGVSGLIFMSAFVSKMCEGFEKYIRGTPDPIHLMAANVEPERQPLITINVVSESKRSDVQMGTYSRIR